jgi:DNA invertase Pin-like site-specific DNA recombinase
MVAEFERDLIVARRVRAWRWRSPRGDSGGKAAEALSKQEAHLVALHREGKHTGAELAELFTWLGRRCTGAVARAGAAA